MEFDIVHNTQKSYRKVVDSMSRPGIVNKLKNECEKINFDISINKGILLLMIMLLDREVTYCIESENKETYIKEISQLTYSKQTNCEKTDFLFVLKDSSLSKSYEALEKVKVGTLIDPQKSTTIIYEVDNIYGNKKFKIMGPGVDGEKEISINISDELLIIREIKNVEYPLGVDFIFIDKDYNIMCIPRTTSILKEEN
ncbi:MAG: phosphonate C-P lyase system protein PhnH [Clostridium sp.]